MTQMEDRRPDGSAGDADYGSIGKRYAQYRRPEPRIVEAIGRALGGAETVLNVGAGAGSYEPADRKTTAIEPSASMRAQRPPNLAVAINAVAEKLPFPDASFDASMATFTVHQWNGLGAGLAEMRRVTRGPVIILTCDPDLVQKFWLNDYAPDVLAAEARRYPALDSIATALGRPTIVKAVPIPLLCADGFNEAYYGRPEWLLEEGARLACSAWSFVDPKVEASCVDHLGGSLRDGRWDALHGHLRKQDEFDGSLRLIVSRP
jgi:hypothetical protein